MPDANFVLASHLTAARRVVRRHLHITPIVPVAERVGASFLDPRAKLETRQIMGSFKTRGAIAAIAQLREQGHEGLVTASAGNHGLGVAFAAAQLGLRATIVVPKNLPENKLAKLAQFPIEVLATRSGGYDQAEESARKLASQKKIPFLSPFDHPVVAAGNGGTTAVEILQHFPECDAIVLPVGGGGLLAGVLAALREKPQVTVIGAQSETNDAMARSLESGTPVVDAPATKTLAEGLEGGVSLRTFAAANDAGVKVLRVSEAQIGAAMATAFYDMGEVIEGSAAVALAALSHPELPTHIQRPCVLLTGRNVDRQVLDRECERALGPKRRIR